MGKSDAGLQLLLAQLPLPAWLSKSNAVTTPVFADEFDSRGFNGFLQLYLSNIRYPRPKSSFETLYRRKGQPSSGGKLRLRPAQKSTRSPELINCLHDRNSS
jgi:hypothetical protein